VDVRREVFLIFKETINNAVRHSGCTRAAVDLRVSDRWLVLSVADNGRGLHSIQTSDGTGLGSMRQRAERLGGTLQIDSPDAGAKVTLRIPLE